jgi:hypothetical protein
VANVAPSPGTPTSDRSHGPYGNENAVAPRRGPQPAKLAD